MRDKLPPEAIFFQWQAGAPDNPYRALLGSADGFIVTGPTPLLGGAVDAERGEVAGVEPDHGRVEPAGWRLFMGLVSGR